MENGKCHLSNKERTEPCCHNTMHITYYRHLFSSDDESCRSGIFRQLIITRTYRDIREMTLKNQARLSQFFTALIVIEIFQFCTLSDINLSIVQINYTIYTDGEDS